MNQKGRRYGSSETRIRSQGEKKTWPELRRARPISNIIIQPLEVILKDRDRRERER